MAGAPNLAAFAKLFTKGSIAEQVFVYGILNQVLSALLAPELELLTRGVNEVLQATPLSPADLADMVVRNIVARGDAEAYAKQSGVSPDDFARMVASAGSPPSPQELIAALRRGIIPHDGTGPNSTSFVQGIAEGRTYNKWRPVYEALADQPIGVADAVDAVVESQITMEEGQHIAFVNGVSADNFQILYNTRGNPPSPTELLELWKRGIIQLTGTGPEAITVEQGIAEGATKNKWFKPLTELAGYITPPRSVVAMVRDGSLTDDQGLAELAKSGLDTTMAAAYVAEGHHQKTQATRDLTVSSIVQLYQDRLIDRGAAEQMLENIRYTAQDAAFELDIADFKALEAKVRSAVTKVQSLFVAHHIDAATATTTLTGLDVPQEGITEMLQIWTLERDANVAQLTAAEVCDAVYYEIIDLPTGVQRLENLGWTPEDAIIRIGIRLHGLPTTPPPAAPSGA